MEALAQRGLSVVAANGRGQGLWPERAVAARRFYALMKHYSFRLFLRDVVHYQPALTLAKLTRFVSSSTAQRYIAQLDELGVLDSSSGRIRLTPAAQNFGTTLEWFVALALRQEMSIPVIHGVRLGQTGHGGDYDVIGLAGPQLLYVEVKSSPPKHIEDSEIDGFLRRISDLGPDVAIFLVDTNLRMRDKVVVMFEQAARRVLGQMRTPSRRRLTPERIEREIFRLGPRLFIANSKHELVANLRTCIRSFFETRFDLGKFLTSA